MVDLVFKNYTSQEAPRQGFFKNILETATKELKINVKIETSINLAGEDKMKDLNKKYRHKDMPTDVLSFPLGDGSGDIFICLSIAKKEAKRENIDIENKLAQLTVHGFLHLAGYDHEKSQKGAEDMFSLEKKILDRLEVDKISNF